MRVKKLITLSESEVKEALCNYVENKHKIKVAKDNNLQFLNGNRDTLELFDKVNMIWHDETTPKKVGLSMWARQFNCW
jgi:hypothetical protein